MCTTAAQAIAAPTTAQYICCRVNRLGTPFIAMFPMSISIPAHGRDRQLVVSRRPSDHQGERVEATKELICKEQRESRMEAMVGEKVMRSRARLVCDVSPRP